MSRYVCEIGLECMHFVEVVRKTNVHNTYLVKSTSTLSAVMYIAYGKPAFGRGNEVFIQKRKCDTIWWINMYHVGAFLFGNFIAKPLNQTDFITRNKIYSLCYVVHWNVPRISWDSALHVSITLMWVQELWKMCGRPPFRTPPSQKLDIPILHHTRRSVFLQV